MHDRISCIQADVVKILTTPVALFVGPCFIGSNFNLEQVSFRGFRCFCLLICCHGFTFDTFISTPKIKTDVLEQTCFQGKQ